MSFADLNTIVVTGTYLMGDDSPARGTVTFDMPSNLGALLDSTGNQIVVPTRFVAVLNASGRISIAIPASDDPDVTPSGWPYTVT